MSTEITKEVLKELIIDAMKELHSGQHQEWWNLQDATKQKGLNYKTACNRRELQPNRGMPDGKVGGRNVWHRTTIEKWLEQTDDILKKHEKGIIEGWKKIDKHSYQEDKANLLPVVTFSTSLPRRKENTVTPESHTGIINLDLDENAKDTLDSFARNIVPNLHYMEACGLSVSGKLIGYRWVNVLIEIPDSYEQLPDDLLQVIPEENWLDRLHKLYHRYITELFASQYGIKVGEAKDLKRNRTLCHDSCLYVNKGVVPIKLTDIVLPDSELNQFSYDSRKEHFKGESNPQSVMDWLIEQEGELKPGSRSYKYVRYYGICNNRGIPKEEAIEYAKQFGGDYQKIGEYVYKSYATQFGSANRSLQVIKLTDMGNAENLKDLYGDTIRYCALQKKWYIYDSKQWKKDDTKQIDTYAKRYVKSVVQKAEASENDDLIAAAQRLESKTKIENMLKLFQSEVPITPEEFDADSWKLNIDNGILDLKTGILKPHSPKEYHSKLAPVTYKREGEAPLWNEFLNKIFDNNESLIEFVQKAVGYALTGSVKEHVIFILHGHGANGKTTFLNVIQALLGDYAQQMPASSLLTKRSDSQIPNDIARLKGARFVAASETDENRKFSESLIKQLTGGDTISARFLYGEYFDFRPSHKIFLASNHKPNITGTDYAIWRRLRLIPFTVTIPPAEQDKELTSKLLEELPGVLNWAWEGLAKWLEKGLEPPEVVKEATEGYREEMDTIESFIKDVCLIEEGAEIASSKLFKNFTAWAEKNGERSMSQKMFSLKLEEKGYEKYRKRNGNYWKGIDIEEFTEAQLENSSQKASA